jgi:hypothetical protein
MFSAIGNSLGISARELRQLVIAWCRKTPTPQINGTSIEEWIQWNFNVSMDRYLTNMARDGVWGGAQEMAVIANALGIAIIVFQGNPHAKRISEVFPDTYDINKLQAVCILWVGQNHYMELSPNNKY